MNKLFLFLLLLGYSLAQYDPSFAIASSWSMWSPWSFCSNNVMIRVRACSTFRGFKCIGHNKEFQSCNSGQKPSPATEGTDYDHEDHQDREQAMKQLYQDYEPALPDHPHTAPRYRQPAPTRPPPMQTKIQQYSAPGTRTQPVAPPGSNNGLFNIKPTTSTTTEATTTLAPTPSMADDIATPGLRKYKAQYVTKTPTTTPLNTISEESSEFSQEYDEAPTVVSPVKAESGVAQAPILPRYRPATGVTTSQPTVSTFQRTAPVNAGQPPRTSETSGKASFHRSQITVMGERQDMATVLNTANTVASEKRQEESRRTSIGRKETPETTRMSTVTTPTTTVNEWADGDSESEEEEVITPTRNPVIISDNARQRYLPQNPQNPQSFSIGREKVKETTTEATTTTMTTTTSTEAPVHITEAVPVSFQPQSRHAKIFEIKRPFVSDTVRIPANFFANKGANQVGRAHSGEFSAVQQHLAPLKPIRAHLPEATNEQEKKKLLEETASLEQKIKELEKKMELKKRKKMNKEVVTTEDDVLIGDTARALSWMLANMTSQMEMGNMPIMDMIPLDRIQKKKKLTPEQKDLKRRLMKENKDLRVVQAGVITHPLPNGVEITLDFPVAEASVGIVKVEPKKKHTGKKRKITWSNWSMWSDCRCGTQLRKRICMPKKKSDGTTTSCPPAQHEMQTCKSDDNC